MGLRSVTVRIGHFTVRGSFWTRGRYTYNSVSHYREHVVDDCMGTMTMLPGEEIWLSVGRSHSLYISEGDLVEDSIIDGISVREVLYNILVDGSTPRGWIDGYLPYC